MQRKKNMTRTKRRRVMTQKRRYVRRKKVMNKPYTKISKQPVAERYFTRLHYCENVVLSLALPNVLYGYQFQSSIFDPDFTGVGHQPLWHDQFNVLYDKYRVYGIKYDIMCKSDGAYVMTTITVKPNENSAQDTAQYTLLERREGPSVTLEGPNGKASRMKGYMSVAKTYGLSKKEYLNDDGFVSAMSSNPSKLAFLQIYGVTIGGLCNVTCKVHLTYYVEFMQRVNISGS